MHAEDILTFFTNVFSFDENHPLLFTQFYFWAFFALVFAVFSLTRNKCLLRNSFLFFVSLFFYYKTSGLFVIILIITTLYGFFIGRWTEKAQRPGMRKLWMIVGVVLNLSVLFYFKYAYFFTDSYNTLVHSDLKVVNYFALWANELSGATYFDASKILLPVGISFYTFQSISYLVDVYRRKCQAIHNMLDFGFYVSFFPGLVAGPIIRADQFVPQLYKKYFLSRRQFGIAVFWILNGLAKKIIMSDFLATNFIDRVFDNPYLFTPFENLSALFIYSLQVYADFSGYTDIAIGVAMLMGFYLPVNFNSPYKATNAGNFWKRWHISLSNWLKDYLYIPMGGNRNATAATFIVIVLVALAAIFLSGSWVLALVLGIIALILGIMAIFWKASRKKISTNINNMNTMLLGGLWHGASWNFMIWGGLNGLGILVYKFWKSVALPVRTAVIVLIFGGFVASNHFFPMPLLKIGCVWTGAIAAGTVIKQLGAIIFKKKYVGWLDKVWGIAQTFVFISFTRLFFRSGSNLDPATANETAWNTAKSMVTQIGGQWDFSLIPQIVSTYASVFMLFGIGMVIHWLPDRWKRWYRYNFAMMPLWLMALVVVVTIFALYQFITADMQPFIYFQF
ncbi:MAG: MBOAT family protein [Bacteroidales bacterium]|nr:MBOAT family protein [Bacteroidales bacterium]